MRFLSVSFLFVLTLLFFTDCQAQIYPIHHYSVEEGLASRSVFDITQDNTGRMWFATNLGVSVYDGFEFTNITLQHRFNSKGFRKIKTDEKGIIWAVPFYINDTIYYLINNKWETITSPSGITEDDKFVTGFDLYYENDEPVLCLGSDNGIFIYTGKNWKRFSKDKGLIEKSVCNITAGDKKFFISTYSGLSVYSDGKIDNSLNKLIYPQIKSILNVTVEKLTGPGKEARQRIWILGFNKLGYIEDKEFKLLTDNFQIPHLNTIDRFYLTMDTRNIIYFGNTTVRYYVNINSKQVSPLSRQNGLAANGGTSVYADKEDNVWFSDNRGVDKINNLTFRNHSILNGLPEDEVSAVNEIFPGVYVFGHNYGISIFKDFKYKYISFEKLKIYSLNASRVQDLYKDNAGNIWISASKTGLGKIDKSLNISWISIPKDITITSANSDIDGNIIASTDLGIFTVKNNKLEKYPPFSSIDKSFRKVFRLRDGSIWATGYNGVYRYSGNTLKHIFLQGNYDANSIYSVFKDGKNRILLGTEDGLYQVLNDSLVKFNEGKFSISESVFAICQDKSGNYWFGTEKNLIKWDGAENVREYNSNNGLVPGEINRSAVFFDSSGKLWIGTDAGLSRYVPEFDEENHKIPSVEIIGLKNNTGEFRPFTDDITLKSDENTIRLFFRGISFVEENAIVYRVKLEGFDKDWVEIKQSQIDKVTYWNLNPGDYIFKVKAKNHTGDWSSEVSSKKITISNPFYKKLWFILMVILALAVVFYVIYKYYIKSIYLKALEKRVERRTKQLNESRGELEKVLVTLEERVKERTEELEKSEEKYRTVFEQAAEGIIMFDIETKRVIQANKAYLDLFGFSEEELLKLTFYDLVLYDEKSLKKNLEILKEKKSLKLETRLVRHKDGSFIPVESNLKTLNFSGREAVCVILRDMREREKIEEELRENEKKFRELVEFLPEAVYETDAEGKITFVNSAGLEMMGYSKEELESGILLPKLVIHEERGLADENMRKRLSGTINRGFHYRALKKDGTIIPVYMNAVPVIRDDKCIGTRGIAIDITAQKKNEEDLKEIAEELKKLNASKDKFFSVVAHDLRNPFTGVIGFTDILLEGYKTFSRDEIKEYAEHIRKTARNTFDLLENLLQWGRIQTNRIVYSPVKLNLHNRIDKVLTLLRPAAHNKEITIIDSTEENTFIKADKYMFQSVMQNLISNAIKFTNRKGTIEIDSEETGNEFKISVKDNGIGISPEILERLFDLETVSTRAGTEKESGTGLGLIICKDMLEKQDGTISVESEPGKGSKFTITLPKWVEQENNEELRMKREEQIARNEE